MLSISCVNLLNLQDHCIKPIQAFQHPSFKAMIAVAAHATHGVTIPSLKVTRAYTVLSVYSRKMLQNCGTA